MADEQDLPDDRPEGTSPPPPAKKAPAKKAPAKKVPAKKAVVKKAPAKKAPAKKAPAKKAPDVAAPASPPLAAPPLTPPPVAAPAPVADGAKEAAAQAKSTVDRADDSVSTPTLAPLPTSTSSRLPLFVAVAVSLLAILLVRQLRRGSDDAD